MKRIYSLTALLLVLGTASPAYATTSGFSWVVKCYSFWGYKFCFKTPVFTPQPPSGGYPGKPGAKSVPEIDAAAAAISLALVTGVVSIGRERRKRRLANQAKVA